MKAGNRINRFIELVSNIMEAYTTCLFLADNDNEMYLSNFYSLGKNIKTRCKIKKGEGIVGWVFREQKPVLASYFDKRDATTLKFYKRDEDIKSFLAIPLPKNKGVICVDSKKSYIFTEEKEKILINMASILLSIIDLENEINEKNILDKLLSLSLTINELILNIKTKEEFIKDFLFIIKKYLNLNTVISVIENNNINSLSTVDKKDIYLKYNYEYMDNSSLAFWIIKNKKDLFLENFIKNKKSFLVNKEEKYEFISNFLGFYIHGNGNKGVIILVKKNNEKWNLKEKNTAKLMSDIFIKNYFNKK
ncbi:MAG: GAF domain-containing protein [Desulfobulbaceae bacterium]|nr:GAF domain-containing protein [Desulfobulbaceae bacterium]